MEQNAREQAKTDAAGLPAAVPPAGDLPVRVTPPAGARRLRLRVDVPDDACLEVELEARAPGGKLLSRHALLIGALRPQDRPAGRRLAVPALLAWSSLVLYLIVRLIDLPGFPIYFFTDEAVQTVHAADLLRNGLRAPDGEFLPTFFQNGSQYNLGVSVYLQALPYLLFGKSIWVTRGMAALMTVLAAASVGIILNRVFKSPSPWLAVLILSATPAWFLHSRTAFETALAVSFYAAFLSAYLLYRVEQPRLLPLAVIFGALAFYSYSGMRAVILLTGGLLFLSDLRYHLGQRRVLLVSLGLAGLLALPFARFVVFHADAMTWQMRLLGSYWLADLPLSEKLAAFALEWLRGLNPLYWYLPNTNDLPRHLMLNYGHLLRQTLPFGLMGVGLAAWRVRDPRYRALLIALIAAPGGAALVRLGITRALVMVIPMALLTALAVQEILAWAGRRWKPARLPLEWGVFALLATANLFMLVDALSNGPRWFRDYGLTGMQWGARQVFDEVEATLRADPKTRIILSPSWANGTDVVARFFLPDPLPIQLASPEGFFNEVLPLDDRTLFIMLPEEYDAIPRAHFAAVDVEKTLPYPDGRPGFYFVRLRYAPNAAALIAAEEAERRKPEQRQLSLGGYDVDITYPRFDIGRLDDLFDRKPESLVRTRAINPLELVFDFHVPPILRGVTLLVGGTPTSVRVVVTPDGSGQPVQLSRDLPSALTVREVHFDFPKPVRSARVVISVKNTEDSPAGYVHLWEISWK